MIYFVFEVVVLAVAAALIFFAPELARELATQIHSPIVPISTFIVIAIVSCYKKALPIAHAITGFYVTWAIVYLWSTASAWLYVSIAIQVGLIAFLGYKVLKKDDRPNREQV